jgi:hypothetical protein
MMTVPTGSASESYIARRISSMPAVGARTMPSRICFCCSMGGGVHDERMRPRAGTFIPRMPLCFSFSTAGGNRCSEKL